MRLTLPRHDGGPDRTPAVHEDAWTADSATLVGDVRVGPSASVWYSAVLRAEFEPITVGARTNLQDGVVVHVDPGFPATLGDDVSVGHGAVLHGCTVEDGCLVGMHATVLNGAVIGAGSLVAAGALVLEGVVVPPGSLVAGVPAKVRRPLTPDEGEHLALNAGIYVDLAAQHRRARPA